MRPSIPSTHSRGRAALMALLVLIFAVALAACGDDDNVGGGNESATQVAKSGPYSLIAPMTVVRP